MTTEEMTDITLLSETSPAWQALSEGDRKALQHLVQGAKILNNVCLQQDNPHNISLKQALEQAAKDDEQAALTLKMFNSLNGVSGLNGIDPAPICLFKGLTTSAGKNFYPQDLTVDEFHQILLNMFAGGESEEIARILSARTMVVRNGSKLKAVDYTEYFKKNSPLWQTSWKSPPTTALTICSGNFCHGRHKPYCKITKIWICWPINTGP